MIKPKLGKHIYALRHHIDCKIYKVPIERVLKSHGAAKRYCSCPVYDNLRAKHERIGT